MKRYAFCIIKDYNAASCDEYDVASEIAREIVQPLYDDVESIEAEIKTSTENIPDVQADV